MAAGATRISPPILRVGHADGHGTASGPMGEAVDRSFSHFAPEDIRAVVAYLRTVPAIASPDLPASVAPPAPASHRQGGGTADARGKMVFEGACVSCHGWTGESPISPFATLTGAWAVNDPTAINVVQVVISGTRRNNPARRDLDAGVRQCLLRCRDRMLWPTTSPRVFGAKGSHVTAQDVAGVEEANDQMIGGVRQKRAHQEFQVHVCSIDAGSRGRCLMARIDERTTANMGVVLEEVFADAPHGGDHESRKQVAKKLIRSAKKGNTTLEGLRAVARDALQELSTRKSA